MRRHLAGPIAVAAAFLLVLPAAFKVHAWIPGTPDTLFAAGVSFALFFLSFVFYFAILGRAPQLPRMTQHRSALTGARITAEQAAYEADPTLTATCPHLQPLERALRQSPSAVRRLYPSPSRPVIHADCRFNEPAARAAFALPAWVTYQTGYMPERAANDNPWALLQCTRCGSSISVLHPDEWRPDTPWFPTAP